MNFQKPGLWPITVGRLNNWGEQVILSDAGYTLSGRMGNLVASHAAVARSIPAEVALIYTVHETLRGYCPCMRVEVQPVNWIYCLWRHCR